MRGDFSRVSFDRARHARGLLMQQGRVQLDADWNELQEVQSYRVETEAVDVIGPIGAPEPGGGFALSLTPPGPLTIGKGRMYVDGLLAENDDDVPVTAQPFLPGYSLPAQPGCYLAYLDVWLREISALDDGSIREVALGGPDTALRESVAWQVKLLRVGDHDPGATCASSGGLKPLAETPRTLRARARTGSAGADPCNIAPDAAFRGVENQLYRVEIHQGGQAAGATFKWSRDNASLLAAWLPDDVGVNRIKVGGVGRDGMPGFQPNQWVELYDDTNELYDDTAAPQHDARDPAGHPGILVQVDTVEDQVLVLKSAPPARGGHNPRVRGWDMPAGAIGLGEATTPDGFIDLENGLQVQFDQDAIYTAGDYWLIPARTITADIDWPGTGGAPGSKPPDGVRHHYASLAVLTTYDGQSFELLDDCRPTFPALTALRADDVQFYNAECAIPGADTVQDALDALCGRTDLREHNRRLHGWGIVCGLALHCGPNEDSQRRNVTLEPGYAIDAQGNDVDVTEAITVDVLNQVDQLQNQGVTVLDDQGDGELCLILDPVQHPDPIRSEKFDPAKDEQSLLTGTLLNDFFVECVKPVWDFLQAELSGDKDHPADAAQQRRATLINLANQAINPVSGQQVYISEREDAIIRNFYVELRKLLTSQTFCAMFEGARAIRDYPLKDVHMDTIFGTAGHNRLRLHPRGAEAYTFGPGNDPRQPRAQINRYNLDRGLLIAEIDPIAGTQRTSANQPAKKADTGTGAVQDVAFSPDGRRIHVAIASRSEDNTIFRSGAVTTDGIQWDSPVTICGMKLVSLATTAADPAMVYAVGLQKVVTTTTNSKGQQVTTVTWQSVGLLRINPDQIDPSNVPRVPLTSGDSPSGPLLIDASGRAVLTGTFHDQSGFHSMVLQVGLAPDPTQATINWRALIDPREGHFDVSDGIDFVTQAGADAPTGVFAVLTEQRTVGKRIIGFGMADGQRIPPQGPNEMSLTTVALAGANARLLVSELDANSVRMIDPGTDAFVQGYQLPTQVGPVAIAATQAGRVVVVNQVSNTLTVISPDLVTPTFVFPSQALIDYRAAMLNAFADLTAGFLQYLKDCLCDHFLVRCPPPDAQHPLRLGCVSIRGSQVYKICNFTGRHYVKSFPTVGYWLSLIPVQPLIARAVEMFCCAVLPERASKISVGDQSAGNDLVSMSTLLRLVETGQAHDLLAKIRELRNRFDIVGEMAKLAARAMTPAVPPPGGSTVPASTIVGQPAAQVAEALRERGVTVRRAQFDPQLSGQTVSTVAGLFRNPQPGQEVTLCEEEGMVRFFSVSAPSHLADRVRGLETSVEAQGQELSQVQDSVATARQVLADAEALRAQLGQARRELDQRDQALADLRARIEAIERS